MGLDRAVRLDAVTLSAALLAVSLTALAPAAQAVRAPLTLGIRNYDCKILARTVEFPGLVFSPPQMNAWGQVAFLVNSVYQQIHVAHGELDAAGRPITWRVADSDPAMSNLSMFSLPVIDDNGLVVFAAYDHTINEGLPLLEAQAIFRQPASGFAGGDGLPVVKNSGWDTGSPFDGDFYDPSTNSAGTLLFAFGSEDSNLYVGGSLVANGFSDPEIHPGARSFYAYLGSAGAGVEGLYVNGALLDSSDTTTISAISVNGDAVPVVSFVRTDSSANWTLEVESNLGHQVYLDSTIDAVGSTVPTATSLNGRGEVVISGLRVANGSELWQVKCQNLPQLGYIGPDTSARAINNEGQIAFIAGDPQSGANLFVRADPIPGQTQLPTSCAGLADGTQCDDGYPPATATCQAGACVGGTTGLPISCAGQPDYTPCDGSASKLPAYCVEQQCVAYPVPEPDELSAVAASVAAAALLVRRRPRRKA